MFKEFVLLKSQLDQISYNNKLLGFIYKKFYSRKINKILKNLKGKKVDVYLLKSYFDFLRLTRVHFEEEFKQKYDINLQYHQNFIKIIDDDSELTLTVFRKNYIGITYSEINKFYYHTDVYDSLINFDNKDNQKNSILTSMNDELIEIMIYSVKYYFKK